MPPPFKQMSREEFAALLDRFDFRRSINAVHMHHTWRPNHSQYNKTDGHKTILGMYLYHTQTKHWQDIAQHITIAPDGTIWLGRNWNLPPASAAGHNGNSHIGPFMFEMIGDFDRGHDPFEGEQRKTVLEVIARMQLRFKLPPETLKFHNAMSPKSCPGSAINYDQVMREVRNLHETLTRPQASRGAARASRPFGAESIETNGSAARALESFGRDIPPLTDPADAEPSYDDPQRELFPDGKAVPALARDAGLTVAKLVELRPHLVNLNLGKFSTYGEWKTAPGDVDAIFGHHLELALKEAEAANKPLRVLFFAHGGLVKESAGLEIASKHLEFWRKNGVYPIYFIWETGLFETIGQLLRRSYEGTRGFVSDYVTDPLIEQTIRTLQGPTIWAGMKFSAERAVASNGGALYVAEKLKEFCDKNNGKKIELHAVGHSAGAVFHAHFLSTAHRLGVPSFKTAHFLAPALRVDAFKGHLANLVGQNKGIDHLSIFTMSKDFERDDHCAQVYRKSLLYLIHYALEPDEEAPILGLEQSLREDRELQKLFRLASASSDSAEVIFSVSPIGTGRSASRSTTHGGFDDDPATMNSLARRVLDRADADPISEYETERSSARGTDLWRDQVDWPEQVSEPLAKPTSPITVHGLSGPVPMNGNMTAHMLGSIRTSNSIGRKRALCIGIDDYLTAPLAGCVADATDWARAFGRLGFETAMLTNSEATRAAIIAKWTEIISGSSPGDVIALQFAGHGTRLPDLNGDEEDAIDEALCPYDFAGGAFLIDDDIREVFNNIPAGVSLTCFFDCCHSGTATRFAVGAISALPAGRDLRKRSLTATEELKTAHQRFRRHAGQLRSVFRADRSSMKNILFSACQPDEVAWEADGHGEFTVRAVNLINAGIGGMTNQQFIDGVIAAFGSGARQRPMIDFGDPAIASRPLLAPISEPLFVSAKNGTPWQNSKAETIQTLQLLVERLKTS